MYFLPTGEIAGDRPDRDIDVPEVYSEDLSERTRHYFKNAQPRTEVDLACHHVISWSIIQSFWNRLTQSSATETKTQANKRLELLRTYLSTFGVPKPQLANMANDIVESRFKAKEDWGPRICWSPNNLVVGPRSRSDDPGEAIDFALAPADIYGGRVSALRSAGRAMEEYVANGSLAQAERAVVHFSSIRHEKLMSWDEEVWAIDVHSPRYEASANHGAPVQPLWRVREATK